MIYNICSETRNIPLEIALLSLYFKIIIQKYSGSLQPIKIVTEIIQHCNTSGDFTTPIQTFANQYKISTRTLQRYFEITTSLSSKKALQLLRIRKATEHLATSPGDFHFSLYGYYDQSHFYKHLKKFLKKATLQNLQPHLQLLNGLRR